MTAYVFRNGVALGGFGLSGLPVDMLNVATDVCTWKLLRHDRGASRDQTEKTKTKFVTRQPGQQS